MRSTTFFFVYWCNIFSTTRHANFLLTLSRIALENIVSQSVTNRQKKSHKKFLWSNKKRIAKLKKWLLMTMKSNCAILECVTMCKFSMNNATKGSGTKSLRRKSFFSSSPSFSSSSFPPFLFSSIDMIGHVFPSLINLEVRKSTFLILRSSNVKTE